MWAATLDDDAKQLSQSERCLAHPVLLQADAFKGYFAN